MYKPRHGPPVPGNSPTVLFRSQLATQSSKLTIFKWELRSYVNGAVTAIIIMRFCAVRWDELRRANAVNEWLRLTPTQVQARWPDLVNL